MWNGFVRMGTLVNALIVAGSAAAVFLIPAYDFGFDISTMLTIISLLIAILIGFFFSVATQNHFSLQSLIISENATLVSLHNLVKLIDPKKAAAVADSIDAYMIASLDYDSLEHAEPCRKDLDAVIAAVDLVVPSNAKTSSLLQNLHDAKLSLYGINHQEALMTKHVISGHHWTIIVLLTVIFDGLILGLRNGSLAASLVIFFSIAILFKALVLINEVDSNAFLAGQLSYESPQPVFEQIGKHRYFPETAIKLKGSARPALPYRVGIYKDRQRSFEKAIKLVTR